ncbi:HAD superfamily hydrolase (TIGR01484 family) [Hoeflea halophila]|uniref:HAD superfamily hydrolase (TIGR01484 family) n=1 Tax=Hoeflea halophila TaxID=714899 RepID=A0A286I3J0_9HYPH|nr:HAD-IIB family hydrolase [Hoeflea halophila]SOE14663.1 HAD superfamily hydrolase (TIGR01484 family) [Hoeflea halophila]
MNSTPINNPLNTRRFVLATDLDGTFLGGSEEDRRRLYGWIEDNRDTVGLIFVTGRDPEFIGELCRERGVPWPDYAVGDVGTTIATVSSETGVAPIAHLEEEIAARWANAGDKVKARLEGHPGLTLQPTDFRYRVSYDLDPDAFDRSACGIVEEMGHQWLISDNRYFDVLPEGVSKGPSLRRLVEHLAIEPHRVLCAGDTLNDLSMLECGLPAVAVGNSEPSLVERVLHLEHLHMAQAHGAAGILEAIRAFDMHELPKGY